MPDWMLTERHRSGPTTRFESIGVKLPARHLSTANLMASTLHETSIDLERLTGIHDRRICSDGEDSLSLAIDAARDCLSRSHYAASDLDVVISASITHHAGDALHRIEPPLSLAIKQAIGADGALHMDISNACAGMLTGVFLLDTLIRRGRVRRGIVVSGEHITGLGTNAAASVRSLLSPQLASLTLGDAGAAVIVDAAQQPGIMFAGFTTLAQYSRLCLGLPGEHQRGAKMFTRARKIHDVAMQDGPALIENVLARTGLTLGDIDWFIPHQTSVRALRAGEKILAERIGSHPRHLVVTVDEYANTASTTLFLALHRHLTAHSFRRGEKVMLLAFASGLEVGVVVFAIDELEATYGDGH